VIAANSKDLRLFLFHIKAVAPAILIKGAGKVIL